MPEQIDITTTSAEQTLSLGRRIGQMIDRPLFIGLTGDLGSGKTVLVQGIAEGLGIPPEYAVTSPTFTLVNEYEGRFRLFHVDLYRLAGPADTDDLGMEDILSGSGVVAVEWAERLAGGDMPAPDLDIRIRSINDEKRVFTMFFYGPETANLVEGMKLFS